ncbi:MAG: MarR family transcriptional regulator [Desulfuromonadaceae bacterium]
MRNVTVSTGTAEEFFKRGREIARKIDDGEALEAEYTLTFEDPGDMFAVMSSARLELFRAAKKEAASITALALRLKRDRSSVKKDVDILAAAGLLDIEDTALPGHGRQKFISAAADRIYLQAVVA